MDHGLRGGSSVNLSIFPGHVLVARDPIITRTHHGVVLPEHGEQIAVRGLCLLHEPGMYWDHWGGEDNLRGARIVFEKWAGRPLFLRGPYSKSMEVWLMPEEAILGIEEADVKRDDLKTEIGSLIDSVVDTNRELTEDDVVEIEAQLENVADIVEGVDEDESDEPDDPTK
jgi:hypothetical protein